MWVGLLRAPLSVFLVCQRTAVLRATLFDTPVHASVPHMLWKFQTEVAQGHVIRSPLVHSPQKSWNVRHSYIDRLIALEFSAIDMSNSIYKTYISELLHQRPKIILRPLHYTKVKGRKLRGASFGWQPFETLLNIGLQVDLTPWIGILRSVTPPHVPEVTSGQEKSPGIFRQ